MRILLFVLFCGGFCFCDYLERDTIEPGSIAHAVGDDQTYPVRILRRLRQRWLNNRAGVYNAWGGSVGAGYDGSSYSIQRSAIPDPSSYSYSCKPGPVGAGACPQRNAYADTGGQVDAYGSIIATATTLSVEEIEQLIDELTNLVNSARGDMRDARLISVRRTNPLCDCVDCDCVDCDCGIGEN